MNEHLGWWALALMLATVRTDGGGHVSGDANAKHDFVGRDQIINAPQTEWRIDVDARLREHEIRIANIERAGIYQYIIWSFITLVFILSLIVSAGFIVRRFDYIELQFSAQLGDLGRQIQRQIDSIERQIDLGNR